MLASDQQQPPRDARPTAVGAATASIAGRVTILDSKPVAVIRRARVTLESSALPQPETTDTDTDGRYRFAALPAGSFRVIVSKPGFVTLQYGAMHASDRPAALELEAGQSATADAALPRGAALQGRLLNDAGEPVSNLVVSASRFVLTPAGRRPSVVRQARTDDLGRFRIHSLPAGEYYVDGVPDPLDVAAAFVVPGERPLGIMRTYFPGTPRVHEARRVTLTTGQEVSGLEFTLASVPVASVAGRVVDSTGKAPAVVGVRLQAVGGPPGEIRGFAAPTRSDFQFPAVPAGDYWLTASLQSGPNAPLEAAATRVTVAGVDQQDITLTTSPGMLIDGRIELDATGATPSPGPVEIKTVETEFELPGVRPGTTLPPTIASADGRFAINGLFGPRLVRVAGLPAGWALKAVWLGDTDITDIAVDFRGSNAARPMRIVLTDKTGALTGSVTDSAKRPARAYRVIVFPPDERRWGPTSRFVFAASPARDGRFTIKGLLPGQYLLAAVDRIDEDDWHDPDVLRRLKAGATPITIGEQETQTVTLVARRPS